MTHFQAKLHMPRSNSELLMLCTLFYIQQKKYSLRSVALLQDLKLGSCGINPH
jgi:hypothetical protein